MNFGGSPDPTPIEFARARARLKFPFVCHSDLSINLHSRPRRVCSWIAFRHLDSLSLHLADILMRVSRSSPQQSRGLGSWGFVVIHLARRIWCQQSDDITLPLPPAYANRTPPSLISIRLDDARLYAYCMSARIFPTHDATIVGHNRLLSELFAGSGVRVII